MLRHLPDDSVDSALEELVRILVPGGILLFGGHVGSTSHIKQEGYRGHPMRVQITLRAASLWEHKFRRLGLSSSRPTPLAQGGIVAPRAGQRPLTSRGANQEFHQDVEGLLRRSGRKRRLKAGHIGLRMASAIPRRARSCPRGSTTPSGPVSWACDSAPDWLCTRPAATMMAEEHPQEGALVAQFVVLIYSPDSAHSPGDTAATSTEIAECDQHIEMLTNAASMTAAWAFTPRRMARSIRADGITVGPYYDTPHVVAGVYVLEAPDLDSALATAATNPVVSQVGGVEVRPVHSGSM